MYDHCFEVWDFLVAEVGLVGSEVHTGLEDIGT